MPEAHKKMLKTISDSFTPKVIYDIGSNTLHWTKEAKNNCLKLLFSLF